MYVCMCAFVFDCCYVRSTKHLTALCSCKLNSCLLLILLLWHQSLVPLASTTPMTMAAIIITEMRVMRATLAFDERVTKLRAKA